MPKKFTETGSHVKSRALLKEAGYTLTSRMPGALKSFNLEFWASSASTRNVVLQHWDNAGTSTYADWPLGETWDAFKERIK